jgi:hypothetical protein
MLPGGPGAESVISRRRAGTCSAIGVVRQPDLGAAKLDACDRDQSLSLPPRAASVRADTPCPPRASIACQRSLSLTLLRACPGWVASPRRSPHASKSFVAASTASGDPIIWIVDQASLIGSNPCANPVVKFQGIHPTTETEHFSGLNSCESMRRTNCRSPPGRHRRRLWWPCHVGDRTASREHLPSVRCPFDALWALKAKRPQTGNLRLAASSVVGETGFEPATARPPAGCATRLRHSPWSLDDIAAQGPPGAQRESATA